MVGKLSALAVTKAKRPGMYGDGGGLYLQVKGDGAEQVSKSWIFRYRLNGHTSTKGKALAREMGLGSLDTWTLTEARERARQQRQLLDEGRDPIEVRKLNDQASALEKAKTKTFQECAKDFIKAHKAGWKNAKHAEQWAATLETWAYPIIGKLAVGGITTDLVLKVLEQPVGEGNDAPTFWTARTETASRVRGRIENILDWARAKKLRDGDNPARWKGLLDKLLPAKSRVAPVQPQPALPYRQLPEFLVELRQRNGVAARALEFMILTVTRTHNVVDGKRLHVDKTERIWTIPAAEMKGKKGQRKRDHVVPLSDHALSIMESLSSDGHLFPGDEPSEPLSTAAMAAVIDRMNEARAAAGKPRWIDPKLGRDAVPHGFRSSFKDWCTEQTEYPNEMSEMALAHTVPDKVEAAYRRGDMLEKRRRMMADWATFCGETSRRHG
ncbi:integrase [Bradyrhizobium sp. CIR48]|uniref:tyrosine-type recombinase/integrase n=1 Tax=Bradyrhizobium sp. CIR48 TaxID=2663840 RepID=UPI001606DF3D|nr:integrase arm-type DNA-binding domain-containing protein [Bradyrhizobium sp. CIR48]MBB4422315.1 integrase [Bradyrhizobium sp. CIR48]